MADDQREALYALGRTGMGRLTLLGPDSDTIRRIDIQKRELEARGMRPVGISLSMDVLMKREIDEFVRVDDTGNKLLGLPLTIIGDANGIIAWSFKL